MSLEDLIYKPANSLVVQGQHSRLGAETTNGDGFGIGWYGDLSIPGVYHSVQPVWHDRNLRELAMQARAGQVFAHIRAAIGSPVQETNCHPFRYGRWLWMHNGYLGDFLRVKRSLVLKVDPTLYPQIAGSTDSEVFFFLALSFGLEEDPPAAVARAVEFIESTGREHGVEQPIQMTVATTDGVTTWAFRYSTNHQSRSLFRSTEVSTLRHQYPDNPVLHMVSDDARVVVSEPLGDLHGAWHEVPESTCIINHDGESELRPFSPTASQVS